MMHEILIDVDKLVRNFDELYEKVMKNNATIKVVKNDKVLLLSKGKKKPRKVSVGLL